MIDRVLMAENEGWKQRFAAAGLDLTPVWQPSPEDLSLENRQLRSLWEWLEAYRRWPDRPTLESRGFRFPPIEPDCDPDTDWLRFERWLNRERLAWNAVAEFGPLPDSRDLTEPQITELLDRLLVFLSGRGVEVDFPEGMPDRAIFDWLRLEALAEDFELTAPGTMTVLGCTGYCPGCFKRPWCETGREPTWPEDDRAGQLVLRPEVEAYRAAPK